MGRAHYQRQFALVWQSRLAGLVELQAAVTPPPELWSRIDAQLTQLAQAEAAAIALAQANRLPPEPSRQQQAARAPYG